MEVQARNQDFLLGGGGGVWEVKAQTSRRVREHAPSGKFEKTWITLNCISCIFKVEK